MEHLEKFLDTPTLTAIIASVLHVTNYNATAHLEYNTRIFSKILGKHAIYIYAVYLVASALVRDHFINEAMKFSQNSLVLLPHDVASVLGTGLFIFGILLNLWTLQALGIKGMYNGDSFGFLMDAPVTGGPYKFFNDPQYFGTTAAFLGSAIYYQSRSGYIIAAVVGLIFYISVKFIEGPHLNRIYSAKNKKKSQKAK
eukprot:Phypoly_transcript_20186.p1 GENE.Phypoly_transcript_20186~~Phypoly_transcript_20186.p1  ORF type:complete len:198 (+),score=23.30 Phypoly_transcript_20186:89-682(+)